MLKYCSWTPKPAKQEWIEKSWNNPIETHRFINLQGYCVYCSWHVLWTMVRSTLMKMMRVLLIAQAQLGESSDQNGVQLSTTIFILFSFLIFSQLPWQNAFKALQCSVWIIFNELHLPTNHKTIKTEHIRYKQIHYAELFEKIPSVFPSLELTFSLLGTSLSSLWVSAFIGKLCITSHAL